MVQLTRFEVFDIILLVILLAALSLYLYKNRKRLGTEGILLLYRTQWGVKLIDFIGKKYKKTLKFLSYVSIAVGYFLMAGILYLFGNTIWSYLTKPEVTEMIKAPPIAPLIPYFPRLFGLSDFFPALYGIYFIAAIVIVATLHEFSHGIFARRYGVRIKSTGFAFLKYFPAIFGAFVEQDERDMTKRSKFQQMSILTAGVFANVIVTIIFAFLIIGWFNLAFAPAGVMFQNYAYSPIEVSSIVSINVNEFIGTENFEQFQEYYSNVNETDFVEIETASGKYLSTINLLNNQEQNFGNGVLVLYEDVPAINVGLKGVIVGVEGEKITGYEKLSEIFSQHEGGDEITITTLYQGERNQYEIELEEHPRREGPYLGVMFSQEQGFLKTEFTHFFTSLRQNNLPVKGNTYHEPVWNGTSIFVYYLLWWIILINFLVALFNMLPLGILDGGRFFYLTIWGITGKEKAGAWAFKFMTYLILFAFILLMVKWVFIWF